MLQSFSHSFSYLHTNFTQQLLLFYTVAVACCTKYVRTNDTVSHSWLCCMCTCVCVCDMFLRRYVLSIWFLYLRWACACLSILLCLFVVFCVLYSFSHSTFVVAFFCRNIDTELVCVSVCVCVATKGMSNEKNITLNLLIAHTN